MSYISPTRKSFKTCTKKFYTFIQVELYVSGTLSTCQWLFVLVQLSMYISTKTGDNSVYSQSSYTHRKYITIVECSWYFVTHVMSGCQQWQFNYVNDMACLTSYFVYCHNLASFQSCICSYVDWLIIAVCIPLH